MNTQRKKSWGVWACGFALGFSLSASAQSSYTFAHHTQTQEIDQACTQLLTQSKRQQLSMRGLASSGTQTLKAFDTLTRQYEDTLGPLNVLGAVHPNKALRDRAQACELQYQAFSNRFFQDKKIYSLLKKLNFTDPIDQRYQRDLLDAFEDAGVHLSAADKAQAQALSNSMTQLAQKFQQRISEDKTQLVFTEKELEGVASEFLNKAPRNDQGHVVLGLEHPTLEAIFQGAKQAQTRERFWRSYLKQGGVDNLRRLQKLIRKRQAYAQLFGFKSYADFALRRRMAGSAQTVDTFLNTVQETIVQRERDDLGVLKQLKAQELAQPDVTLERWDVGYYTERARKEKFSVAQEQFRKHFPPQASLEFAFELAQRLFGIRFEAQAQTLWHPQAKAYGVYEEASHAYLGTLFVDLYPRKDKYNHAAVWSFRNASSVSNTQRTPAAALVVNFNSDGLSLQELETLLHEFGHALHSLLSTTRYTAQGGTNTQLDFVEAPSQMLEDWVYEPKVLALFQTTCPTCEPVAPEVLAQARLARDFGKGITIGRQLLFTRFDLALHTQNQAHPMRLWQSMEAKTPLGHVPGSMFPASFSHIAGGYGAGYYSYLWSMVLAEDLRTAFLNNKLSSEVGQRYRQEVLAQGGQAPPLRLMQRFLGRPFNDEAFLKSLKK
jgi:thimet oligopeptidase